MLTPKENVQKLFNHEKNEYMPIYGEGIINNTPVLGYYERAAGGKSGKDWFGVNWAWKEGEPAPMPTTPWLLDDICDWRDAVQFPDLEAFDWDAAALRDRIPSFDRENHCLYQMIHNGLVERLQNVMAFEDALCALLEDPDEVSAFFDALVDYKCRLIDKIAEYYRPDIICYHDDWGTQRGLIFSPETWRSLVKEPTKRIVDHVHSKGIKFDLHSDGLVAELIPEVVEDLHVDAVNIMAINDIPSLKKQTGGKVVYDMFLDLQKYDVLAAAGKLTEDDLRKGLYEDVMKNADGGCFIPTMILVKPEWQPIISDVLHQCQKDLL